MMEIEKGILIVTALSAVPPITVILWLLFFTDRVRREQEETQPQPPVFRPVKPQKVNRSANSHDKHRSGYVAAGFAVADIERPVPVVAAPAGAIDAVVSVPAASAPKKAYQPPTLIKHSRPAAAARPAVMQAIAEVPVRRSRRSL